MPFPGMRDLREIRPEPVRHDNLTVAGREWRQAWSKALRLARAGQVERARDQLTRARRWRARDLANQEGQQSHGAQQPSSTAPPITNRTDI